MKNSKTLNFEEKINKSFTKFFVSHSRDLIAYGGAGAGKSFAAAQKLIVKCFKYPKRKVVIIRKYGPSLRRTCFDLILELLAEYGLPHKANHTDMSIKFPNGSQMLFIPIVNAGMQGDPAGRIKSLTDITDMWFEEPTELSPKEYQQAALRLRGQELKEGYRQRIYTFNPIDQNHWLKTELKDKAIGEWQKYTYKDNRFIEKEYIQELKDLKEKDLVAYEVYALGNWGVLGKQVYTNYEVRDFEIDFLNIDMLFAGVDFGWEHPNAWVLLVVKESEVFVIDEICEKKTTKPEFAKLIIKKLEEWELKCPETCCDSSEPASIEELEQAGLWVIPAEKGKDSVIDGISVVQKYKLVIHPRCVNTIKQIQGYQRREDRQGNILEEPMKFKDDLMDAIRYPLYTYKQGLPKEEQYDWEIEYDDSFAAEGKY